MDVSAPTPRPASSAPGDARHSSSGEPEPVTENYDVSDQGFQRLYDELRARTPWGPADRRGALNYLTPAKVLAAARAVKLGRAISLAAPIEHHVAADNPD